MALYKLTAPKGMPGRVATWLWLAFVVIVALMLIVLPGAPVVSSFVALSLITFVAVVVYRHTAGWSSRGEIVLLVSAMLLAVGIVANVYTYTTLLGGSDSTPVLNNNDAFRTYNDALYYIGLSDWRSPMSHGFYPVVISAVFTITGPSITAGLCVSMVATLCTLICVSTLWVKLTAMRGNAWQCMLVTAAVCYFLASGTLLIKDAWTISAFALASVALSDMGNNRGLVVLTIVCAMLFIARPNMLLAIVLGIFIVWLANRHQKQNQTYLLLALSLVLATFLTAQWIGGTPNPETVIDVNANHDVSYSEPRHEVYTSLIGNYGQLPLLQRVLLLPFSAAVQFFIPFPWNFMRDVHFGVSEFYAHIAYPWYAFGGLCIYYLIKVWRRSPTKLRAIFLWGVAIWLIPAWCFGGTISRYGLMAVPIMAPAVAFTVENSLNRKSLRIFALIFAIIILATLMVCYNLQSGLK